MKRKKDTKTLMQREDVCLPVCLPADRWVWRKSSCHDISIQSCRTGLFTQFEEDFSPSSLPLGAQGVPSCSSRQSKLLSSHSRNTLHSLLCLCLPYPSSASLLPHELLEGACLMNPRLGWYALIPDVMFKKYYFLRPVRSDFVP